MENINLDNQSVVHVKEGQLEYIQFRNLKKYDDIVTHCFTTKKGGVSTGEYTSLNLGFNRNDTRENVEENYQRICKVLNVKYESMVLSKQIHGNSIKEIYAEDMGKGTVKESDIYGYDGLITNVPGVALVTFYADCVPVFFLDPVKKVIALAHSGWKGTVLEIAREAILKMVGVYGCAVENIETAIGPSIGQCCFEVDEDVYIEFKAKFQWMDQCSLLKANAKWHIDLQEVIRRTLLDTGVKNEKISISGICTMCNKHIFFSHRGDKGKTGSLTAIMMLK